MCLLLVGWRHFPVTGASLSDGQLVFHMADTYAEKIIREHAPFGETTADSDAYFHDAYVEVPIYVAIAAMVLIVTAVTIVWRLVGSMRRQNKM